MKTSSRQDSQERLGFLNLQYEIDFVLKTKYFLHKIRVKELELWYDRYTGENLVTISTDRLSYLELDELESIYATIENQINDGRKHRKNTQNLETDLCYVFREIEIRENRIRYVNENFGHSPYQS